MADSKETDMPIGTSYYLRGITNMGESVRSLNIMNTINKQSSTVDCNEMKEEGRYSAYKWKNSPFSSIAVLEVLCYSKDWIVQKMYGITNSSPIYVRNFYNGETWSSWRQI